MGATGCVGSIFAMATAVAATAGMALFEEDGYDDDDPMILPLAESWCCDMCCSYVARYPVAGTANGGGDCCDDEVVIIDADVGGGNDCNNAGFTNPVDDIAPVGTW
jgi:hypothetical protein